MNRLVLELSEQRNMKPVTSGLLCDKMSLEFKLVFTNAFHEGFKLNHVIKYTVFLTKILAGQIGVMCMYFSLYCI